MIEKTILPDIGALFFLRGHRFCNGLLKHPNPSPGNKIRASTNEEMNMIWHDYEASHGNIEILTSAFGEFNKGRLHSLTCQPSFTPVGAERNEIHGIGFGFEYPRQARWSFTKIFCRHI